MRGIFQLHIGLSGHRQHQLHLLAVDSVREGHLWLPAHLHGGDLAISEQHRQEINVRQVHGGIVLINEPRLHIVIVQRQLRDLIAVDQQLFIGGCHSARHARLQCGDGRILDRSFKGAVKLSVIALVLTPLLFRHLLVVTPGSIKLFTAEIGSHVYQQIQIARPLRRDGQILRGHGGGDLLVPAVKAVACLIVLGDCGRRDGAAVVG